MAEGEKKFISSPPPPLPPRAIIPDVHPSVHLKIKIAVTVRRCISKRSREKIGDCEQSNGIRTLDFCDTRAALATLSRGRKPKMREYQRYKIKRCNKKATDTTNFFQVNTYKELHATS